MRNFKYTSVFSDVITTEAFPISRKDEIRVKKIPAGIISLMTPSTAEKKMIYDEMVSDESPAFFMDDDRLKLCFGISTRFLRFGFLSAVARDIIRMEMINEK